MVPLTFKKIFGKGSTRNANYNVYDESAAPFYKDEEGNLYLPPERQMRIYGVTGTDYPYGFIRYNPATNQFERPVIDNSTSYMDKNTTDIPDFATFKYATGEWEPMKLYKGDAEHPGYWFHPGGKRDDLYSLQSLANIIQNDVVENPHLMEEYNDFVRYYGKSPEEAYNSYEEEQRAAQEARYREEEIRLCGAPGCFDNWSPI